MKEWHRTILLVTLLVLSVGVLLWMNKTIDANFVDSLR